MFVRIKRSGPRQYLQVVENYREGRKVRQRVIMNLGRLDILRARGMLDLILTSLAEYSKEIAVISAVKQNNQLVLWDKEWGTYLIFRNLWEKVELDKIITQKKRRTRYQFDVERAVFYTVLHRLTERGSDLAASKWQAGVYDPAPGEITYHHFLRAMSYLERFKEEIEQALFQKDRTLFEDSLDLVFFDTTSIYFEGEGPEGLGAYGHSKDHRPDRKQLVIGVVMTRQGDPICCETWPGNISDIKALLQIVKIIKERFSIQGVILVCDRGMVSQQNLEELQDQGIDYIVGVRLRLVKEVRGQVLSRGGRYQEVKSNLKVKEAVIKGKRYIVCLNPEEARKDKQTRAQILTELEEKLKGNIKGLIANRGYKRYLRMEKQALRIDYEKVKREDRFDGKFVLTTNTKLPAAEVANTYKCLWQVEYAFRTLKEVLETRPIFHRKETNIKGHIFCSYLALCLLVRLRKILEGTGKQVIWDDLIRDMGSLRAIKVRMSGKEYLLRTPLKGALYSIFQALGLRVPPTIMKIHPS